MGTVRQLRHPANGAAADVDAQDPQQRWREDAACRGLDLDLFFPDEEEGPGAEAAKAVCAACPVQDECLRAALANKEGYGIWGGTTPRDRRRIQRRSRRTA